MQDRSSKQDDLRALVKSSLVEFETNLTVPGFNREWNAAKERFERGRNKGIYNKTGLSHWLSPLRRPVYILTAMLGISFSIYLFLNVPDEVNEPLLTDTLNFKNETIIDANHAWRSPTDDLLNIYIRKYETRHITFLQYNPITMELIQ